MSAAAKLEHGSARCRTAIWSRPSPRSARSAPTGPSFITARPPESDAALHTGKMLLTDTGGHYMEGSTDITRTFALGRIPRREKEDFTMTARAMLRLMNTVFLKGCSGTALDLAAREVFWKERVNFQSRDRARRGLSSERPRSAGEFPVEGRRQARAGAGEEHGHLRRAGNLHRRLPRRPSGEPSGRMRG